MGFASERSNVPLLANAIFARSAILRLSGFSLPQKGHIAG